MSTRLKQSRVRKQKIASGEIVIPDSQIKKMISARNKIASRDSYRKKLSESIIKRMKAGKYNMRPNLSEMFLHDILNQLYPNQWKYTGDGKFWINNQNPDFIHKKNKLIIELFGDYWHKIRKKTSVKLRVSKYSDYGYDSLVLWFSELRDSPEEIINKIEGFIDGSLSNDKFKAI